MKKKLGGLELERKTLPIGKAMFLKGDEKGYMNYMGEVDCPHPSILRLDGWGDKIDSGKLLSPLGYESFKNITDRMEILFDRKIQNTENDYLSGWSNGKQINFEDELNGGKGYFRLNPNFPNKGRNFPKYPEYRNRFPKGDFSRFEEPGFIFNDILETWEEFENSKYSENNSKLIDKIKYRIRDMREIWTESSWYKGILLDYQNPDERKVFKFFEGMLDKNLPGLEEKKMIESLQKEEFPRQIILDTLKEPIFRLSTNQIKKALNRHKRELKYKNSAPFWI